GNICLQIILFHSFYSNRCCYSCHPHQLNQIYKGSTSYFFICCFDYVFNLSHTRCSLCFITCYSNGDYEYYPLLWTNYRLDSCCITRIYDILETCDSSNYFKCFCPNGREQFFLPIYYGQKRTNPSNRDYIYIHCRSRIRWNSWYDYCCPTCDHIKTIYTEVFLKKQQCNGHLDVSFIY